MLYSRSAEYAIRALIRLAQVPAGEYALAKDIAAREDIPAHFLAKILQQLAREGWLRSCKGPNGGFRLRFPASQISLLDIVGSLDTMLPYQRCAAGLATCSENAPCPMHESWSELQAHILAYLRDKTIADLARVPETRSQGVPLRRRAAGMTPQEATA
ncbi:MAG TPA: Rrf2 family transcriptional regulator [Bryobacteraceae bacterium]|nr:Rrf2 family transcriptional regulator [Bryobacteraceae bacterium]